MVLSGVEVSVGCNLLLFETALRLSIECVSRPRVSNDEEESFQYKGQVQGDSWYP